MSFWYTRSMARTRRSTTPFAFVATLKEIDTYGRLCAYIPVSDEASAHVLKSRLPPADECRLPYHFKSRREQAATGALLEVHFAWPRPGATRDMVQRHAREFLGRRVRIGVKPKPYNYVRDQSREQGIALTVETLAPLDE